MVREILGWLLLVMSAIAFVGSRVIERRRRAHTPLIFVAGTCPLPGNTTYNCTSQVVSLSEQDAVKQFLSQGCTSEVVSLNDLPLDPIAVTSVRYRAAIACGSLEQAN